MKNSSSNSLTKPTLCLIFSILVIVVITVACNILLSVSKDKIVQTINKYSFRNVTAGKIFYLPPHFIILKDVHIWEKNKKLLSIPRTQISFSLLRLLTNRQLYITSISCNKPAGDYDDFTVFLKENFTEILDFLRSLPKQDIALFLNAVTMGLKEKNNIRSNIEINFSLSIKGESVSGGGFIRKNISTTSALPLRYRFNGHLTYIGIALEKVELIRENMYCQLWCESQANAFKLTGYALINTLALENAPQNHTHNPLKSPKLTFAQLMKDEVSEVFDSDKANLYILNIDSLIKLALPNIEIERLNFSINNNPVKMTGKISLSKPYLCDVKLQSNFRGLEEAGRGLLKKIALAASVNAQNDELNINATCDIDFLEKSKEKLPLEKIEVGLKGLKFSLDDSGLFTLHLGKIDFFCRTNSNTYRIAVSDFNAELYKLNDRFKTFEFRSRFYGGLAHGRGRIEIQQFTPAINALIRVKGADTDKLDGILVHFSKIHGGLSSQMFFNTSPQLQLKGGLSIHNGYMKDFEFFKWLADFFSLTPLKKIFFRKTSSNFIVNEKGAALTDMRLDSKDVKLIGDFGLGENDFVSSVIRLSLSKPLLQTSPKLKPLLKLIPQNIDSPNFDFQMSGNLHRMNFQWLQSDFKKEVLKAIPDFVERGIEKSIEQTIDSISREP